MGQEGMFSHRKMQDRGAVHGAEGAEFNYWD